MAEIALRFEFRPDEKIRSGFVRILEEMSRRAEQLGRHPGRSLPDAVHHVRVLGKRLRALLWFGRPALSRSLCKRAKTALRKASGVLAAHRDHEVVQMTLNQLAEEAKPRRRHAVREVAEAMAASKRASGKKIRHSVRRATIILRDAIEEIKRSAVVSTERDWPRPRKRLRKARLKMRKAARQARRTGKDADLHAWRKRVKRLLYLREMFQPGQPVKELEDLQGQLGAHHDATVTTERVGQSNAPVRSIDHALDLLEKRKVLWARQARRLSRKV